MGAPKPPNPAVVAREQSRLNKETAVTQSQLGQVNQTTPTGSLSYEQIGTWPDGTPRYSATQALNPQSQGLFDTLMNTSQQVASGIGAPIEQAELQTSVGPDDFSADRLRVEESLFNRLNPQIDRARSAQEADLIARGVRPGSAAYDRAYSNLGQQENDLRSQIVLAGGQEQSRQFADALQSGMFSNQALQQMFQNRMSARQAPINEIGALWSGAQVNQPNYVNTPQPGVAGVDYAGLVNQVDSAQQGGAALDDVGIVWPRKCGSWYIL